tara:strand:- start:92 stop:316 length:225 start_codon:yes stop_codon:yes gene_type:complete
MLIFVNAVVRMVNVARASGRQTVAVAYPVWIVSVRLSVKRIYPIDMRAGQRLSNIMVTIISVLRMPPFSLLIIA